MGTEELLELAGEHGVHVLDHAASGIHALLSAFDCDRIPAKAKYRPVRRAVAALDVRAGVLLPRSTLADPIAGLATAAEFPLAGRTDLEAPSSSSPGSVGR
jgi:hypothetical protein